MVASGGSCFGDTGFRRLYVLSFVSMKDTSCNVKKPQVPYAFRVQTETRRRSITNTIGFKETKCERYRRRTWRIRAERG